MLSKIEQYLGCDIVLLLECLFDSGKLLHDYKICGNKFGTTVLIRLADHDTPPYQGYSTGKSPSKQLRDIERLSRRQQQAATSFKPYESVEVTEVKQAAWESMTGQYQDGDIGKNNNTGTLNDADIFADHALKERTTSSPVTCLSYDATPFQPQMDIAKSLHVQTQTDKIEQICNNEVGISSIDYQDDASKDKMVVIDGDLPVDDICHKNMVTVRCSSIRSEEVQTCKKLDDNILDSNIEFASHGVTEIHSIENDIHLCGDNAKTETCSVGDTGIESNAFHYERDKITRDEDINSNKADSLSDDTFDAKILLDVHIQDLMDTNRNNYFKKVVCDRRTDSVQLIGMTDDLVMVYDVNKDIDVVFGVWENEYYDQCEDAIKVLNRWKGLKGSYPGRAGMEERLKVRVVNIHNGQLAGMFDINTSSTDSDTEICP